MEWMQFTSKQLSLKVIFAIGLGNITNFLTENTSLAQFLKKF